jgi:hypothetical protein
MDWTYELFCVKEPRSCGSFVKSVRIVFILRILWRRRYYLGTAGLWNRFDEDEVRTHDRRRTEALLLQLTAVGLIDWSQHLRYPISYCRFKYINVYVF